MIPAPAASIRRTAAIVLLAVLVGSSLLVGPVTAERAQVAQPVQTAQTGQPGQPVQPVQPAQPGQPVQPAQPGQPVQTAPVAQQSHPAQTAGGTVVVEANETVDSLEALGGTVVVRGTVANDVEALGGTVRIADTGRVGGDVDATGGSIGIDGTVNGTVQAVGGSVVIGESARIGGDLDVAAGSLTLAGTVGRDVRAAAETIRVDASASVGGDLRYDAETFDLADGAAIEGQVVQEEGLGDRIGGGFGAPSIPWWVWTGFWFVANLLLGAVLVGLLPSFSRGIAAEVVDHPLRSGGVGLGVLVGLPILLGLLAITLVGLPLALLGLGAYVALLWIGTVYGAYAVGAWGLGLGGTENRWLALVVGLVAVAVLGAVPYLGELVEFLVLALGLGALTVALWQRFRGEEEAEEPGDRQATVDERDDRPTSS